MAEPMTYPQMRRAVEHGPYTEYMIPTPHGWVRVQAQGENQRTLIMVQLALQAIPADSEPDGYEPIYQINGLAPRELPANQRYPQLRDGTWLVGAGSSTPVNMEGEDRAFPKPPIIP